MKNFFCFLLVNTIFLFTFCFAALGQDYFYVEGAKIKTGNYTKTYHFFYEFRDTLWIALWDSVEAYANPEKTLFISTTHSTHIGGPYIRIDYLRANKQDSITKFYIGNAFTSIYEHKYDSLDRIIYHSYMEDSGKRLVFKETFFYSDSLANRGKVVIQKRYDNDEKEFHVKLSSFYDEKNRIVMEISEWRGDSLPQVRRYVYNKKDVLIKERWSWGHYVTVIPMNKKSRNSRYRKEISGEINAYNYREIMTLAKEMVLQHQKVLIGETRKNVSYKYKSTDNQRELIVSKIQPYWEGGQMVTYSITQIP